MSTDELLLTSAPDLIDPVVGFRQWRVSHGHLLSLYCDEVWPTPTLDARCRRGGHRAEAPPASLCSCGVHAWYDPCPRSASWATRECVAGAVVMWGVIELHADGMRAQHCRVVALEAPMSRGRKRDRVVDVAECLGVPLVRHRHLASATREHGIPVPRGLRPTRYPDAPSLGGPR